ncbi:restriction endonuclease subunit S [Pseudochrobactrum asaccharolyticum]|uniref:restriction endonuclease subunit S n=1 Tax=Pseudochrobactrum asaccharolyticum TaxID=354351 RepID=UPI004042FF94
MQFKPYPEYKDSGVEWLGEVPLEWVSASVGKVFHIFSGATPKSENPNFWDGHIKWATNTDFSKNTKYINSTNRSITEDGYASCGAKLLPSQSLLLTTRAGIGSALINTEPMCTNQGCKGLVPKKRVNVNYSYYLILSSSNALNSFAKGTTFTELSTENLSAFPVSLPEWYEQNQIVSFLDQETSKIDLLISKQEKLIKLLEEQRKSIISHAVTKGLNPDAPMKDSGVEWLGEVPAHWRLIKSKKILSFSKGLTITKENLQEEGIPTINYGEVHSKYGFEFSPSLNPVMSVPFEYVAYFKNCMLNKGDFVFADTSEDLIGVGNFSFLNTSEDCFAGYHTIIARLYKKNDFRFLAYEFESQVYREQLRRLVKGIKVFSITQEILKNSLCWLPKIEEQRKIVEYLDRETSKIDTAINKQKKLIEKLKEYRSSIISHAVTGKIDVRDLAA